MGRPKGSTNNTEREDGQEDGVNTTTRVGKAEPKDCPNCGAVAVVRKDNQGMVRCHCSACGYWDSVAHYTEAEAIESWNGAGGIPKPDYS
jgi:hypothetical protein